MMPLLINSPESMFKVKVITVKDSAEQTLKVLHRIGVLHVEESAELKPIDKVAIEKERNEVSELLGYVEEALKYLPEKAKVSLTEDLEVIYTRPFRELRDEVKPLHDQLATLHQRITKPSDRIKQLTELKTPLEPLAQQTDISLRDLHFSGGYLFARVFAVPSDIYQTLHEQLKDIFYVNMVATAEHETVFHAIARDLNQETIETAVRDSGGRILQIPVDDFTLKEFLKAADSEIAKLELEVQSISEELQDRVTKNIERLVMWKAALSAENERLQVLEKASESNYITLIEGWIPESSIERATSEIRENIAYAFIDTKEAELTEKPPTKLKNRGGFKPFQVLVNLFGTPKYREWDPTPVLAYSFAFFFGLMVGDVIYALGIILVTKFLLKTFVDDPESEGFKLFQRLLYISSTVALIIGLLTGNYLGDIYVFFGIESLALSSVIRQLLGDPISFIVASLIMGFFHVNTAHILTLIKAIKERQKGIIFNKIGLFISELVGIPLILHTMLGVDIPFITEQMYSISLYILLAGVVLVIIGSIMESGVMGAITGAFDLTGVLGDIMSYCRLAGVGLATFYLASSFNLLADLFRGLIPGTFGLIIGTIIAIAVLILGHLINVALGAITGFIHSLRLCFVEFLFKFYEGGGREYSPFKFKKSVSVVITGES